MTFTLTESLRDSISGAMENQDCVFLVDAARGILVAAEELSEDIADTDNYYALPRWESSDGYSMMEDFTSQLHQPLAQERLLETLHGGRGVFRNFKTVLKDYPEVEKKWHVFKNSRIQSYISDWYNGLREIWGLEKLDFLGEAEANLVHDDFTFRQIDFSRDKESILEQTTILPEDDITESVQAALNFLWRKQFESFDTANQRGFICHSLSEDFAGCITSAKASDTSDVAILTNLFVPESFRGLGIGSELLDMCKADLKNNGIKWLIQPNIIMPETMEPLFLKAGFRKMASGYVADLQQN